MVFVLLTYGGWNEAAYLSGELQNAKRNMARALVVGVLIVIALYLSINFAYLHVLGLDAIRKSDAVGRRHDADRRRQSGRRDRRASSWCCPR